MATTPPRRKSKYLSDKDYEKLTAWNLNQHNAMRRKIEQGDRYDGIIEFLQNAIDSTIHPLTDYNHIEIEIPCLGDLNYGKFIMSGEDCGQEGLLKDYNGDIMAFINGEKSISFKGDEDIGQNGEGTFQYLKVGQTIRIVTQTKELLIRFYMVFNDDGIPSYTNPEIKPITEKYQQEFDIFKAGTKVTFLDPYEGTDDIDVRKVINKIKETFGWRMLEAKNLFIYVNRQLIDPPEYLYEIKADIKFMGRLGNRIVNRNGIPKQVNPEIRGFIKEDKNGRGMAKIHCKGYYVCDRPIANKQGTAYINCDQLAYVLTPNRKGINDDDFAKVLDHFLLREMRDLPDIKQDKNISQKQLKSIADIFSNAIGSYLERFMKNQKAMVLLQKRIASQGGEGGNKKGGYEMPQRTITICEKCGHKNTYYNKDENGNIKCPCDCHPNKSRKPNSKQPQIEIEGGDNVRLSSDEQEKLNKNFDIHVNDTENPTDFLSLLPEVRQIDIFTKHDLFSFVFGKPTLFNPLRTIGARLAPYMARVVLEMEHPTAYDEMSKEEYRRKHDAYTIDILGNLGLI